MFNNIRLIEIPESAWSIFLHVPILKINKPCLAVAIFGILYHSDMNSRNVRKPESGYCWREPIANFLFNN